jgi:hypothetical protein
VQAKQGKRPIAALGTSPALSIGFFCFFFCKEKKKEIKATTIKIKETFLELNNFENSAIYQIYTLETAIANDDCAAMIAAANQLPHGVDVSENYVFIANLLASSRIWNLADSTKLFSIAFQRIDEGGTAVIAARNMLGIYVDDSNLPNKSNRMGKNKYSGYIVSVAPNPNNGKFALITNMPVLSQFKIIDSLGKIVHQGVVYSPTSALEIENLRNGLYHLAISDVNGKLKSVSFVISK